MTLCPDSLLLQIICKSDRPSSQLVTLIYFDSTLKGSSAVGAAQPFQNVLVLSLV